MKAAVVKSTGRAPSENASSIPNEQEAKVTANEQSYNALMEL